MKILSRLQKKVLKVTDCKFATDHIGIDKMYAAALDTTYAASAIGSWTATPSNGQEWIWKKFELLDKIELGSNNIFAKTLRAFANFIVTGNQGARVIRQLGEHFKPAGDLASLTPTGPIVLGKLDGRTVVQDPFLSTTSYFLGHKGDDFLGSSFIYAPYIPLFSTATLITSDLVAQKGKRLPLQEEIFEANLEYAGNSLEKETISRDNNLSWPPETTKGSPKINLN